MGASIGTTGKGTLLKIGDGASSESFSAVLEVRRISGPNLDTEFVDATHMESPSNYREQKPSFKVAGDVTFDVNFLPDDATTQAKLLTDYDNQTLRNFELTFASFSKVWSFSGYVKQFGPSADPAEMLAASVTIAVSGAVTRA